MRHLALRPSEYFRRQVKVAALPYEGPGHLIELAGPELFMFGSDWPHAEGVAHPGAQGEAAAGTTNESGREGLLADNARWLLGMTRTAQ